MDVKDIIKLELGIDSYEKGKHFDKSDIEYMNSRELDRNVFSHEFLVASENYYTNYRVIIITAEGKIYRYGCSCPQFNKKGTCKHLAACLLNYTDIILPKQKSKIELSEDILKNFYSVTKNKKNIKEALKLKIEFNFEKENIAFSLAIGPKKTYIIKTETKLNQFLEAIENNEEYRFGVNFTYDSDKYFLTKEDEEILKFIAGYKKEYGYYNYYIKNSAFELNEREFYALLDKLKNKKFSIKDYGEIDEVIEGMPTEFSLDYDEEIYKLNIENIDKYYFLDSEFKYIAYNHKFYIIPIEYSKILKNMEKNEIKEIIFKKENMELFKNVLLKSIKNELNVSDNITDIIISGKPIASIYFDLLKDKITAKIKLDYKGNEIDYFDKVENIIRDNDYEEEIINDLLEYKFDIKNKKIELKELDDIGVFLSEGIIKLSDKYKIYTTKKIDNMSIIKKSTIKSNFSIGKDGIMSYNFDTDNIDRSELNNILNSLKAKKNYYKLKNGNLIDLNENKELQELNNIFNDLELDNKDLASGNIEIPKYRAFYIDSLKNNKYKSIDTNNTFDKFINNFKKYKKAKIDIDESDLKILRDYQIEGIKWLYTLYKCDLGGILADEMGLGKSLQTICFIKQILKEKPEAKIMIVCPTSLVYNWKKEFDKFAKELKYITVAENKEKRKEIIKNIDKYNIFITSYGLIRNDNDEYEKVDFELCVIDEAQTIKNYQANMTKEVKKIKARTKIALTGTPLENSVLELWSIFDFIMPGYLNSIIKFREKYGIKDVDQDSLEKLSKLNYQIKPFILRRKKSEVSKELPDKIENNVYLELPDMQKALYLKVLKTSEEEMNELIATEGFKKARFKILQLLTKLRQICIDPSILYENYNKEAIKIEKLLEIVKDSIKDGHKILIFSSFKRVIDKVKHKFDLENITSYVISGEVKSKERMNLVEKFNKDDTNCFLITLKAGGTGLNLTSADIVIHLDIWWNPQVENQATDRAHRIGQKNKVIVTKLITKGTIEEKIIELQNKKKILSENLIEGKEDSETLSSLSEKEMKELLSYGED